MSWIERFTDNFNRVDQDLNWGDWSGSGMWGTCKIQSQLVTGSASPNINMSFCFGASIGPDQYAEADLNAGLAFASHFGLVLRTPGGTDRGYAGIWAPSTGEISMYRFSFPGLTALTGGPSTWAHPLGATGAGRLRFEIQGQLLSIYWNGVLIGSQTDDVYATGTPGVINSAQTTLLGIDNFSMGEWVSSKSRSQGVIIGI
jgi:hypothetical protein